MKERLVIKNCNVIIMSSRGSRAQALAVEEGRIAQVGSNEKVQSCLDQGWTSLDLEGKTILPGFIDMVTCLLSLLSNIQMSSYMTWSRETRGGF